MNLAGARAEELCAELLRRAGLRMLARNWRCRLGEIDLVAEEAGTLVFAEVRLRRDPRFGGAAESVTAAKRARILAAARLYLARPPDAQCRFDVLLLDSLEPGASSGSAMRSANSCARGRCSLLRRARRRGALAIRLLVQSSPLAGFRYARRPRSGRSCASATRSSCRASPTIRTTPTRCACDGAAASSATCRGARTRRSPGAWTAASRCARASAGSRSIRIRARCASRLRGSADERVKSAHGHAERVRARSASRRISPTARS